MNVKVLNIKNVNDEYYFNNENNDIDLNENFDDYVKSYDINKNDLETNSKVFSLLTMKLKKELEYHYIIYIDSMKDDEELNKNLTKKQINKSALNYINSKYKELIKTKNYKLLSKIQKKYNIEPQKELVFNYC
jgi:PHP family Zn ribbon phosphoesterase